jgi:L-2,4-diaminobutyric acid acetyltransferase
MQKLAADTGVLEANSCYAYLLVCTHFSETSVVAEGRDGKLLGFVAGYRPPTHPEAVFVWQIGVRSDARGQGLGGRLLNSLVDLPACREVDFLEATVAASNVTSDRLFRGFARARGVACEVSRGFDARDFGPSGHESEPLLRIGPLRRLR